MLWKGGAIHEDLVARFHDPDEEKASLAPFPREQLPEAYQKAFEGKTTGDFVGPFELEDRVRQTKKFAVAHIEEAKEGGDYTIADWRLQLRDQLSEERSLRRLIDQLRRETYVSVRM
jgi:peptidyl-prolyl cis-trans isomerase SurA